MRVSLKMHWASTVVAVHFHSHQGAVYELGTSGLTPQISATASAAVVQSA